MPTTMAAAMADMDSPATASAPLHRLRGRASRRAATESLSASSASGRQGFEMTGDALNAIASTPVAAPMAASPGPAGLGRVRSGRGRRCRGHRTSQSTSSLLLLTSVRAGAGSVVPAGRSVCAMFTTPQTRVTRHREYGGGLSGRPRAHPPVRWCWTSQTEAFPWERFRLWPGLPGLMVRQLVTYDYARPSTRPCGNSPPRPAHTTTN